MAVILVADFGGELIQRFARHVPVVRFQPVDPGDELVPFLGREREHAVFHFGHTGISPHKQPRHRQKVSDAAAVGDG